MDGKLTRGPASQWHAVTLVLKTSSCAAAALCRNTRYLARAADIGQGGNEPAAEKRKNRGRRARDQR